MKTFLFSSYSWKWRVSPAPLSLGINGAVIYPVRNPCVRCQKPKSRPKLRERIPYTSIPAPRCKVQFYHVKCGNETASSNATSTQTKDEETEKEEKRETGTTMLLYCFIVQLFVCLVSFRVREARNVKLYLLLIDGDPVSRLEPAMVFDVVDAVLQVAEALRQVHLEQIAQQILQIGAEVRRKSDLRGAPFAMQHKSK